MVCNQTILGSYFSRYMYWLDNLQVTFLFAVLDHCVIHVTYVHAQSLMNFSLCMLGYQNPA